MMETIRHVPAEAAGSRVDAWLQHEFPDISRSRWQSLLKSGDVLLNKSPCKASSRLRGGEELSIDIPPPREVALEPEDIPLEVLYEDRHLLVIDKPAGMVVHPAAGNWSGTLVNAILHHCDDLAGIGGELRPGIVHRLDKDTSGALVIAKTESAMRALTHQFKERSTIKIYQALVWGRPSPPTGTIETEIGRSRHDRKRMSVKSARGRLAVTHYETLEVYRLASLLQIRIETGRTHQIRVHMAHIRNPVVGDPVYGGKLDRRCGCDAARQMLHAKTLEFTHPESGGRMRIEAALPPDMLQIIDRLRRAPPPQPS